MDYTKILKLYDQAVHETAAQFPRIEKPPVVQVGVTTTDGAVLIAGSAAARQYGAPTVRKMTAEEMPALFEMN